MESSLDAFKSSGSGLVLGKPVVVRCCESLLDALLSSSHVVSCHGSKVWGVLS